MSETKMIPGGITFGPAPVAPQRPAEQLTDAQVLDADAELAALLAERDDLRRANAAGSAQVEVLRKEIERLEAAVEVAEGTATFVANDRDNAQADADEQSRRAVAAEANLEDALRLAARWRETWSAADTLISALKQMRRQDGELLAAARAEAAQWKAGVEGANRISQTFEERALKAEAESSRLRGQVEGARAGAFEVAAKACDGRASAHDLGSESQREAWKCASTIRSFLPPPSAPADDPK